MVSRLISSIHSFELTKEIVSLIYCILARKTIDAGKIVQTSILNAAWGATPSVCFRSGKSLLALPGPLRAIGALAAPRTIYRQLEALEHSMETQRQLLDLHRREMEVQWGDAISHMTYMQDFTAALAQWFSSTSPSIGHFHHHLHDLCNTWIPTSQRFICGGNASDDSWYYKSVVLAGIRS